MSQGTIYVDCPCCGSRLEVEKENGKVAARWEKKVLPKGEDAFKAALAKLEADKKKRENWLANAKETMEERKRKAEKAFEDERERIVREGDVERPPNPMDLD